LTRINGPVRTCVMIDAGGNVIDRVTRSDGSAS
jgi:hypothetical protein